MAFRWLSEREFIDFIRNGEILPAQKLRYERYFREMGYL